MIFKKLVVPDDKELFFVGDIHGHYDLYKKGVEELGAEDAVIISVGDVIDRGSQNLKCLEEFTRKPDRHMVLGNHEDMMIKGKTERNQCEMWLYNGGLETLAEVGEDGIDLMVEMLADTPVILEVHHRGKTFGVVHGGIPLQYQEVGIDFAIPEWKSVVASARSSHYSNQLIWDRDALDSAKANLKHPNRYPEIPAVSGIDFVIHGHSPMPKPMIFGNRVYQDVGSFYSGNLCFSWLNSSGEMDFWITNNKSWGAVG